jgi:hypothetical protein
MYKISRWCFALVVLMVTNVHAQLLSVSPAFPKEDATISILLDCSKGNKGLLNYATTSDVYVHIGVITSASTSSTDWKYVKFTWGSTDAAARVFNVSPNKYQYTINQELFCSTRWRNHKKNRHSVQEWGRNQRTAQC